MTRSSDIKDKLKARRSIQKVLQDRLRYVANRELVDPSNLPMLGISEVNEESLWLLNRIFVDADPRDREEHLKKTLSTDDLAPAILDFTPQNYEWLRELHKSTLQSLSYIVNRLIESCRYDTPWEIHPAPPDEIVKAMELVQKYEYSRKSISQFKGTSRSRKTARLPQSPEFGHRDDGPEVV